jgi:hypothetical protein
METPIDSGELRSFHQRLLTIVEFARRFSLKTVVVLVIGAVVYFSVQRAYYLTRIEQLEKTIEAIKTQDETRIATLEERLEAEKTHREHIVVEHDIQIQIYEQKLQLLEVYRTMYRQRVVAR